MSRVALDAISGFYESVKKAQKRKVDAALADQETLDIFLAESPEARCRKFIDLLTVSMHDLQTYHLQQDESPQQALGVAEFDCLPERDQVLSEMLCGIEEGAS